MSRRRTMGPAIGHRTTLAPVSSSAANSRMSLGPSKMSTKKRQSYAPGGRASFGGRKSIGGRQSMSGRQSLGKRQSFARRQSTYPTKRSDPRPIGDKAYLQENIKMLITFLTTHHYDSPISPKLLTSPTSRDFRHIVMFLFQQVDPNLEFDEKNFEEEFKTYLAELGYPFNISKSGLKSPGSPHTWPSLLAALCWVIEILSYSEEVEMQEEKKMDEMISDETNAEKAFFTYLANAYTHFLEGEDDHEVLEQELKDTFDKRDATVHEAIAQLTTRNETLEQEIDTLSRSANKVPQLEQQRAELRADLSKFQALVDKLTKHKQALQQKLQEQQQQAAQCKEQIAALEADKAQYQDTISKQEFSPLEVQRMNQEKNMLSEGLQRALTQKSELQDDIWKLEMQISKSIETAERCVMEYNRKAQQMELIPSTAAYANGIEYELRLNPTADDMKGMLPVDLKRDIKPALADLREEFQDRIRDLEGDLRDAQERAETLSSLLAEKKDDYSELEMRVKKLQDAYKTERETMNKELKASVAQVEDTELEIHRLQTTGASQVTQSAKLLKQLQFERDQLIELTKEEQAQLRNEVCTVLDELTQHKVEVSQALETLKSDFEQVMDSIA